MCLGQTSRKQQQVQIFCSLSSTHTKKLAKETLSQMFPDPSHVSTRNRTIIHTISPPRPPGPAPVHCKYIGCRNYFYMLCLNCRYCQIYIADHSLIYVTCQNVSRPKSRQQQKSYNYPHNLPAQAPSELQIYWLLKLQLYIVFQLSYNPTIYSLPAYVDRQNTLQTRSL